MSDEGRTERILKAVEERMANKIQALDKLMPIKDTIIELIKQIEANTKSFLAREKDVKRPIPQKSLGEDSKKVHVQQKEAKSIESKHEQRKEFKKDKSKENKRETKEEIKHDNKKEVKKESKKELKKDTKKEVKENKKKEGKKEIKKEPKKEAKKEVENKVREEEQKENTAIEEAKLNETEESKNITETEAKTNEESLIPDNPPETQEETKSEKNEIVLKNVATYLFE
jgi:hypothetical protein